MRDRLRLRPTVEQYHSFGDHLCEAHSWYKHLPLLTGCRFVVFVAPDAGIGRLIAVLDDPPPGIPPALRLESPEEGPEFTDEHPRLHHTWQTTREYRSRFGHLDYMHRWSLEEPYSRDAGPPVRLPDEVEERCGFVLYPYVSAQFSDAVTWPIHEEALALLREGAEHPARKEVLELARLAKAHLTAGGALGDRDRDWLFSCHAEEEKPRQGHPSAEVARYLELDDQLETAAASLRAQEGAKIKKALAELDNWLLAGE